MPKLFRWKFFYPKENINNLYNPNNIIKLYNLYNPNNIGIISNDDFSAINLEFLNREFEPLDKKVLEEYTVSSFVKTIILDNLK